MLTSDDLKAQSHAKLAELARQALALDDLADRYELEGKATLLRIVEAEQRRVSRWRRLRINAHRKVWG